ncbi:hypothetical protein BST95_13780 [Halioglobus japonicus]|uniref:LysR family transcriptional regulator n=1 Tax=Halioglobus japonicus TaxID=930805 RepID=A0AAP8MHK6_9GAMM|nr:LysR family transcriptional regulator [Halioglobus japonicus]AQA19152.1 hypothetical protein BST95_13780 [Halioglobus japonicus]PLW87819.1 LysR family transcriptional regulator [Halioglobus japonicus]GHD06396.1 LysR family transcriptional regulator [Halioglobus japonicus]
MKLSELGRLDLNLLVALEALLEERSVSRAAERLFITQSAMSKTLGRLRDLFDDPLFVRSGAVMVPTPRAEQLAERLPEVLQAVQSMVQPQEFDPGTYEGEINLLVQGHMGAWFVPPLVQLLQERAPRLRLNTVSGDQAFEDKLADGTLDLVFQIERLSYPSELDLTTLGIAEPVILARKAHPLAGRATGVEELAQYPMVSLLSTDIANARFYEGASSELLEYERQYPPQYHTDDLQTALQILRTTDCVFPAPPMFTTQFDLDRYVVALPVAGLEELSIRYVAVRHRRVLGSPVHDWMYTLVLELVDSFRQGLGLPDLKTLRSELELAY